MKLNETNNWRETLSFREITLLEDFRNLLTSAVEKNKCMLCDNPEVLRNGLCWSCFENLDQEDYNVALCLDQHQVKITVELPEKFPWENLN